MLPTWHAYELRLFVSEFFVSPFSTWIKVYVRLIVNLKGKFFLQIYRVFDMELVRVLPSADDEVNVACFHPSVGGGFVYGTKVSNKLLFFFP